MPNEQAGPRDTRPRAASQSVGDQDGRSGWVTNGGDLLARLELIVLVAIFAVMLVIGSLQVINRYALNLPIWNTELLLPHLFIALTFLGMAAGFRQRAHIAVDLLPLSVPAAARRFLVIGIWLLVCTFLAVLIYSSVNVILFQIEIDAVTNMNYPAAIVTATVPLGCALGIVHIVRYELLPLMKARS